MLLDFLGGQHVVQRVVQRPEVRHDFLVKVARQKAERFAGLDGGTGENDAGHFALTQGGQRHGHGQVGLARARRADAEGHVVFANGVEVVFLPDGLGRDAGLLVGGLDAVGHEILERRDAFVLHDVQSVAELAVAHGRAGLEMTFE